MATRTINVGPYNGSLVETYEGTNPHKTGSVFLPSLGIRLDAKTGEILPNQSFSKPDVVMKVDSPETIVLKNELQAAEAEVKASNALIEELEKTLVERDAEIAALKEEQSAPASTSAQAPTLVAPSTPTPNAPTIPTVDKAPTQNK